MCDTAHQQISLVWWWMVRQMSSSSSLNSPIGCRCATSLGLMRSAATKAAMKPSSGLRKGNRGISGVVHARRRVCVAPAQRGPGVHEVQRALHGDEWEKKLQRERCEKALRVAH